MRLSALFAVALTALAMLAAPASAVPTADSDSEYAGLGRVFPDPLANCEKLGTSPCSPNAQGNVPATQFLQYPEVLDSFEYMNTKAFMNPDERWSSYMEVWPLDGKLGDGAGSGLGADAFPGNDLGRLEFDPEEEYQSAGLPTTLLERDKSDLVVVRVTDEKVPDAGKKRYVLSLSIHGIERAGIEGGVRAIEDLVTARTIGKADQTVVPAEVDPAAPSFREVLRKSIIYFTFPNPDGWRRGDVTEGGVFFQRYNGNGVDLNRDWPDIGFSFRPYSGLSEPETRALAGFLDDVKVKTGSPFAAGDDLHGQPFADALSYTLLPHGSHGFGKDLRIRGTAIAIHEASEKALEWSPIIQPNDAPQGGGVPCAPGALGDTCAQIYGQTWGTVYDTINYTTTGSLGDYFDSSAGLNADGIDNEMSFSHLDKNINFDPHTEQLHVDGNKILIYAHLANILKPVIGAIDTPGGNGYVPTARLKRPAKTFGEGAPSGTSPQQDVQNAPGTPGPGGTIYEFDVERDADTFNGGMRIDATAPNAQGVSTGTTTLAVQCRGCDEHPGVEPNDPDVPDDEEWITVSEDFNQSPIYAQAGVTVAINRPQAFKKDGTAVDWRAVVNPGLPATFNIDFTSGPATTDGATGGDDAARLAAYDVANTDFFERLNPHFTQPGDRFSAIDPRKVIAGTQSLDGLSSLVLADDALPGYTGPYKGEPPAPTGPKTADMQISGGADTVPGASEGAPGTFNEVPIEIGANDLNAQMKIRIDWDQMANDYDMFLYRVEENGDETLVGSSLGTQGTTNFEEIVIEDPAPGKYRLQVDNFAAAGQADPWEGAVTFTQGTPGEDTGTGAYTPAEKNKWFDALRAYARGGGNVVLTDGAMDGLSELADVTPADVDRTTVYAGQSSFAATSGGDTTDDPLAADIEQPGARFNGGEAQKRRQMFEPTPLGFSIQDADSGADESNARQFHVDKAAFEAAGGRVVATSADSGTRGAAADFNNVTIGEVALGAGTVRIAGALLPQPTAEFDHPLGIEPFAVTYTGYIVFCNLIDCDVQTARGETPDPEEGAGPGTGNGTGNRGRGNRGGQGNRGRRGRRCVSRRGGIRGRAVGRARLGRKRGVQRRVLRRATRFRRSRRGYDRYCVTGGRQLRIGYPTRFLNRRIGRRLRRRIRGRAVLVVTASRTFRPRRVRVGMRQRALRRRLRGERSVRVFKSRWYFVRGRRATFVYKMRGNRVREVGLANKRLARNRRGARRLLRSFRGGRR